MRIYPLFFSILLTLFSCHQKTQSTEKEQPQAIGFDASFEAGFQHISTLLNQQNADSANPILRAAFLFMDTAYVGKTLEVGNDSLPVLNLRQLDCLTFVENALALEASDGNRDSFIQNIVQLRYKNSNPQGYTSRLHYFSAWMMDNIAKGWVKDVTCEMGGTPIQFHTYFMSENPQYYPQLKADSGLIAGIRAMEAEIQAQTFCYVPKQQVASVENLIKDGDVLGITTNIKGLDFAHNGFAVHKNNRLYMLHASSDFKKVRITDQPLADYLMQMKHMTGIVVLRVP